MLGFKRQRASFSQSVESSNGHKAEVELDGGGKVDGDGRRLWRFRVVAGQVSSRDQYRMSGRDVRIAEKYGDEGYLEML